jgi:hypothetical protein
LKEKSEDESLRLALLLSRNEAEEKERQKRLVIQYPPIPLGSAPMADDPSLYYLETQTKNELITIKPFIKVGL